MQHAIGTALSVRTTSGLAAVFVLASLSAPALAQASHLPAMPQLVPAITCPEVVHAFVDPVGGDDPNPATPANVAPKLNNPNSPFRTIQLAIQAAELGAAATYITGHPIFSQARGLVHCMPGLYGPTGVQPGPMDVLPILMLDRVDVRGQGARRTVLRGAGVPNRTVFWPDAPTSGSHPPAEVLVDYSSEDCLASTFQNPLLGGALLPWCGIDRPTEELLDGFGLQGGDVQVYLNSEFPALARISDCLFDMRHDPDGVRGPFFGILTAHIFLGGPTGYTPYYLNILNNTFILYEATPASVPALSSRPEAVAFCDVTDPTFNPVGHALHGVGNPNFQNNLVRTSAGAGTSFALLGVNAAATSVAQGTTLGPSNAFNSLRVGNSNGTFFSIIVGGTPTPRRDLNVLANDPAFVGEALAPGMVNFPAYRDWRLLPGSPMTDSGSSPTGGVLMAANNTAYVEPTCPDLSSFLWDMDSWGNPRRVAADVDIGCDEVHGMIMAGTWANDSHSHNQPTCLEPNTGVGAGRRFILFTPMLSGGALTVNGTAVNITCPPPPPATLTAWINPPGSDAVPSVNGTLPPDFQTRYIRFTNPPPTPTPWTGAVGLTTLTDPVNGAAFTVGIFVRVDVPDPNPSQYFNAQAVVTLGTTSFRTNLQSEYR